MMNTISPDRVRFLLDYDPETGIFTWSRGQRAGRRAGTSRSNGYVIIQIDGENLYAHRIAWVHFHGRPLQSHCDHKDGDRSNNKIANLREATPSENRINGGLRKSNKTGLKGVTLRRGRYRATIKLPSGYQALGTYDTPLEAALAYDRAAREGQGEFAVTNEMLGTI